jgi:hypothetical protein
MRNEKMQCLVTYHGDITAALTNSGSSAPHRLNADGNTEQLVECYRGRASGDIKLACLAKQVEPFLLAECRKNGTVLGCRWALVEEGKE